MNKFLANIRKNWVTSALGIGSIAVAGGATINGHPLTPESVTAIVQGIGLIFAADLSGR